MKFYGVYAKNYVYIHFVHELLQASSPCSRLVHTGCTGLYISPHFSWQPDNAGRGLNGKFCCDISERLMLTSAWRVGGNNASAWMPQKLLLTSRKTMWAKIWEMRSWSSCKAMPLNLVPMFTNQQQSAFGEGRKLLDEVFVLYSVQQIHHYFTNYTSQKDFGTRKVYCVSNVTFHAESKYAIKIFHHPQCLYNGPF